MGTVCCASPTAEDKGVVIEKLTSEKELATNAPPVLLSGSLASLQKQHDYDTAVKVALQNSATLMSPQHQQRYYDEKAMQKAMQNSPRLKQVKIIGGNRLTGKIGVLVQDDGSDVPYRVKFSDKTENWFSKKDVEFLPDETPLDVDLSVLGLPKELQHLGNPDTFDVIVTGAGGIGAAVNGRYSKVGMHNGKPKFQQMQGNSFIFFEGVWKMNEAYESSASNVGEPPLGAWTLAERHAKNDRLKPPPTLTRLPKVV
jgi:hypothetical protein